MSATTDSFILGVDIGSTKVAAVVAQQKQHNGISTLEIIGIGKSQNEGVTKGDIKNAPKTKEAIRRAVDEAIRRASIQYDQLDELSANVNVGGTLVETTPESNTITCKSPGSAVGEEDMTRLFQEVYKTASSDLNEIIHLLPLHFGVGDEQHIYDPIGQIGLKLSGEFRVISARKKTLQQIRQSLTEAHPLLREDILVFSPLASGMAVLSENHKQYGVAVVDIGGGTTDVAVYYEGVLQHVAILPFGGNHVTSDIAEGCNLNLLSAEEAKIAVGETDPAKCTINMLLVIPTADGIPPTEVMAKNVALIARARLREIAALVYAEIKKSGYAHKLHAGIVLTGGSAHIKGVEDIFKEITQLHVQIGTPKGLETTGLYDQVIRDMSYSTALGLVLWNVKSLDSRMKAPKDLVTAAEHEEQQNERKKSVKETSFQWNFKNIKDTVTGFMKDDLKGQDGYLP